MSARLVSAALAAALAAPALAAGLPEDSLRRTTVARCLPLFPAFLTVDGSVDADAAARAARGEPGRYLLDPGGAASFAAVAPGEPACFVGHPAVPPQTGRKHVEDVLREWYAGRWTRESRAEEATVYVVRAADGATLEITVTGHGETGGQPGSGVAFALR